MTDLEEPIYPDRTNDETTIRGGGALQQAAEITAIAAPIVAPIVSQVTGHLLNRPPKEKPPQVILPPGVEKPKG